MWENRREREGERESWRSMEGEERKGEFDF